MKDGTAYGGRLKKAFAKLRRAAGKPSIPDGDDPLRRLAIAILSVGTTEEAAVKAVNQALDSVAGWNEIRVSSIEQVQEMLGDGVSWSIEDCRRLVLALQSIFDMENRLSLDRLQGMGRRDAKHYLESLNGVDEYVVASVVLWSLGGHAIPVNDRLLEGLRKESLVHPQADRAEVQAFLERHINASDAKEFCILARALASRKRTSTQRRKASTASGSKKKQRRAS